MEESLQVLEREMEERLRVLEREAEEAIRTARSIAELEELRRRWLGKRGELSLLRKQMPTLPPEQRPLIGRLLNEVQGRLEEWLAQRGEELAAREREEALRAEWLDVTLPGRIPLPGHAHPLTLVRDEIFEIFLGLGFEVVLGPEIELEFYNFIALNIPEDHPARDEQDSFYLTDSILLRTHTSPVQVRTMESRQPPVRVICPGRVYRRDEVDATHSHTFHQVEGLLVDEEVSFGDLKGTLRTFAQKFFGPRTRVRFRPDYFPFTEPSADMAVSCFRCGGTGCSLCKGTGWIEILGCGMVHPQVLRHCGYDPERWRGYAFGMGLDRLAMLKYGIDDIRLLFENDVRFLRQF